MRAHFTELLEDNLRTLWCSCAWHVHGLLVYHNTKTFCSTLTPKAVRDGVVEPSSASVSSAHSDRASSSSPLAVHPWVPCVDTRGRETLFKGAWTLLGHHTRHMLCCIVLLLQMSHEHAVQCLPLASAPDASLSLAAPLRCDP